MGFLILATTLMEDALTRGLFDAHTLSYRVIMFQNDRNRSFYIDEDKFQIHNRYFYVLCDHFNDYVPDEVQKQLSIRDHLTEAVLSTVGWQGKKRINKTKKRCTKIKREVNAMRKMGYYGNSRDEKKMAKESAELMDLFFRESFVNIRRRINRTWFNAIPDNLTINIKNKVYGVKSLYSFDKASDVYRLNTDIVTCSTIARDVQVAIAQYLLPVIYADRHNHCKHRHSMPV